MRGSVYTLLMLDRHRFGVARVHEYTSGAAMPSRPAAFKIEPDYRY